MHRALLWKKRNAAFLKIQTASQFGIEWIGFPSVRDSTWDSLRTDAPSAART
jgi:hypothetical protein